VSASNSASLDEPLRARLASLGYRPVRLLKDDSVSEVWELSGESGKALLKRSRSGGFLLGLPPRWLTRREMSILGALEQVRGVPQVIARLDARTFVREFAEADPLNEVGEVPEAFFGELLDCLADIHASGVACVDLSKRENILVGHDGSPVLMDFQAAWHLKPGGAAAFLFGPLLRMLQRGDIYHVYKHRQKRFPEAPIPAPPAFVERGLIGVHLHRWFLRKPYLAIRRLLVERSG